MYTEMNKVCLVFSVRTVGAFRRRDLEMYWPGAWVVSSRATAQETELKAAYQRLEIHFCLTSSCTVR